jgi:hypothetical protein
MVRLEALLKDGGLVLGQPQLLARVAAVVILILVAAASRPIGAALHPAATAA